MTTENTASSHKEHINDVKLSILDLAPVVVVQHLLMLCATVSIWHSMQSVGDITVTG